MFEQRRIDAERVVITEPVVGSDWPVHLMYIETGMAFTPRSVCGCPILVARTP